MPQPSQISPVSPEIDPAALSRQLRGHEVKYRKAGAGGFRAGKRWIPRRSARNYQLVSIGETMDYEESKKLPSQFRTYQHILHKLPPAPPPEPYPGELMGEVHHGRFAHPDLLMDQPIMMEERLPEPLEPQWEVYGWQTPPHLRTKPFEELRYSPRQPVDTYARASHYRDPLLFEEAPEGVFIPPEHEEMPFELMGEGFVTPPSRRAPPMASPPMASPPTPTLPPRPPGISDRRMVSPPPQLAIPTMTVDQQINQAAQMAEWQAQRV
ncbi:hypothetical protein HHI36_014528 [Cryptolaemus montrouzieri]|uniref:Uncharacterized protein n=1 Tax=Cryptolaemus montrouzieri TaxID=559131 RepID=A0ABD2N2Z4_9CUCU